MNHLNLKISSSTKTIVLGGFFIALGVILPWVFHQFRLGSVFLPMHIPVLLAGFLAGPFCGLAVGFLTPLVSFSLTGMPPLMPPVLPLMLIELSVYGLTAGIFYGMLKLNVFAALILSMITGRIALGLGAAILAYFFNFYSHPLLYVKIAFFTGIPGIILQLIVIPIVIKLLKFRSC